MCIRYEDSKCVDLSDLYQLTYVLIINQTLSSNKEQSAFITSNSLLFVIHQTIRDSVMSFV